jgi:hypothetical protein
VHPAAADPAVPETPAEAIATTDSVRTALAGWDDTRLCRGQPEAGAARSGLCALLPPTEFEGVMRRRRLERSMGPPQACVKHRLRLGDFQSKGIAAKFQGEVGRRCGCALGGGSAPLVACAWLPHACSPGGRRRLRRRLALPGCDRRRDGGRQTDRQIAEEAASAAAPARPVSTGMLATCPAGELRYAVVTGGGGITWMASVW